MDPEPKPKWYVISYNTLRGYHVTPMCNFYKSPSIESFNAVIEHEEKELFEEEPTKEGLLDLICELHNQGDGYSTEGKIEEIKKYKEKLKGKSKHRCVKFSSPVLLAWVYECIRAHPWLIIGCSQPLIIERAYAFYSASYKSLLKVIDQDVVDNVLRNFACIQVVMFHASGDKSHLQRLFNRIPIDDLYKLCCELAMFRDEIEDTFLADIYTYYDLLYDNDSECNVESVSKDLKSLTL